jgi:hypothetical protein
VFEPFFLANFVRVYFVPGCLEVKSGIHWLRLGVDTLTEGLEEQPGVA